jgi:NACalpha-BTF3-like transcription factor
MAYKGGVYTQPVKSRAASLAQFYVQGMQQNAKIRQTSEAQVNKQVADFTTGLSKISATGLSNIDNMVNGATLAMRDQLSKWRDELSLGNISPQQFGVLVNGLTADAANYSTRTTSIAKMAEELTKAEKDRKISPASREFWNAQNIEASNGRPRTFEIKNPETGEMENVTAQPAYSFFEYRNSEAFQTIVYDVPGAGTDPSDRTKVISVPVAEAINAKQYLYEYYDNNEHVKDFSKTIGKKLNAPPAYQTRIEAGDFTVFSELVTPESIPAIRDATMTESNRFFGNDDNLTRFLFASGAHTEVSPDHRIRSEEELNDLYLNLKDVNGNPLQRPEGFDPLTVKLDERGGPVYSNNHREFAKSIWRQRVEASLGTQLFELKDDGSGNNITDTGTLLPSVPMMNIVRGNEVVTERLSPSNAAQYFNNLAVIMSDSNKFVTGVQDGGQRVKLENINQLKRQNQNGRLLMATIQHTSAVENPLVKKSEDYIGSVDFVSQQGKKANISPDVLLEGLSNTTMLNHQLQSVDRIHFFEGSVAAQGEEPTAPMIAIEGQAKYTSISGKSTQIITGTQQVSATDTSELVGSDVKLVEISEWDQLYQNMWDNKLVDFREVMNSAGFDMLARKSGQAEGDYVAAFRYYFSTRNTVTTNE